MRPTLFRQVASCLEGAFALADWDLNDPVQSDSPLAFFLSYPRSGNTVAIATAVTLLGGQVFEALPGSLFPFSKRIYPRAYPYTQFIKDSRCARDLSAR